MPSWTLNVGTLKFPAVTRERAIDRYGEDQITGASISMRQKNNFQGGKKPNQRQGRSSFKRRKTTKATEGKNTTLTVNVRIIDDEKKIKEGEKKEAASPGGAGGKAIYQ